MKSSRVTLAQIAQEVGLHVSTVSRVLNSSGARASDAASGPTADLIRATATRMGYRPNTMAQGLRTRRSRLVGVMVPRLTDYVLAEIYEGIQTEATERQLVTLVTNSQDRADLQAEGISMMSDRGVDGFILGDVPHLGGYAHQVAQLGTPFVLVSRVACDFPSVSSNDYLGGRLMAEHFLQLGHTDVGVISGLEFASTARLRAQGFLDTMAEAGHEVHVRAQEPSGFTVDSGYLSARKLLERAPDITALFVANDFDAIGAYGAIREAGRRVGSDLAVGGYNNIPIAGYMAMPLTSVNSPRIEMGRRALAMLSEVLDGGSGEQVKLEPTLIARESTLGTNRPGATAID
ncbi:LacI family DNA-binding transcriptional regulator [Micrococcales bacterium 31B]|nr:LacI family DNA-binding transcriptional regulator [Micrococcales bacterium 31B]